jgi:hypothetical protein
MSGVRTIAGGEFVPQTGYCAYPRHGRRDCSPMSTQELLRNGVLIHVMFENQFTALGES